MNLSPDTLALLMRIMQRGQARQQPMQPIHQMQRMGVNGAMPQQSPQTFQRLPNWIGVRG